MTDPRIATIALIAALLPACAPPARTVDDAELAAVTSLKHRYPDLISGFEIRPEETLIVSLDLQQYIEADDDRIAAMKHDTLAGWRAAWSAQHPHVHALLHVRFIDFIGRKVAEESTKS
jgi:hypothetical protein